MIKLLGLLIFLVGCTASKVSAPPTLVTVTDIASDFYIPQEILKNVEKDLLEESKVLAPVFSYTSLHVLFTEKTQKTLTSPSLLYRLPKGGGLVDLQNAVSGKGSFFLSFPGDQFKDLPELSHLYFISQAPKIKIDSEEFGLGCGKWVDLKKQFSNLQKENFLNLNTTDNRHIFVTSGHYIFVFRKLNQVVLSQLTITDSKNSFLLCPQVKGAAI